MAKTVKPAKKTKQEKLLEKEERKRERLIMKEKTKQYDGGFMSRCVALLLGFILGIFGSIGGVAGVGYYFATNKTIKEVADCAGAGSTLEKYLSATYSEKTLFDLFTNFGEITAKFNMDATINSLAEISPVVADFADTLAKKLSDFGLDADTERLKNTPLKELQTFLQDTLQNAKLAKFIGANPGDSSLMSLLCFGEKGTDYTIDENGNVTWIGDSHELSVKDFMDSDATSAIFNRISLKAVMETSGAVKTDDPITRALVYGVNGVDYSAVTDADGKESIEMLPLAYTYDSVENVLKDDHGDVIDTEIYRYDASEGIIELRKNKDDENPDMYLRKDGFNGVWYAYKAKEDFSVADKRVLHKATTLGDVMKGDFMGMVEGVEIASLLNVSADSEGTMIALAYGNEGVDYKIEGGKIVMLGDAKPRTIKDLRDGNVKFEDMKLADILKIKPDGSNETMQSLAFGEEGKHYLYNETSGVITWLPKQFIEKNDGAAWALYNADDKKIEGAVRAADGTWSFTENGVSYLTVQPAGAIGQHTFYVCADGDETNTPVCYRARTIADLKNLQTSDLIGGATIESMLKTDADSDGVVRSLAYGKAGVNYEIVTAADGAKTVNMLPIRYSFDGTNWKDENGEMISPTLTADGNYEFLREKDGRAEYVYVTDSLAVGAYGVYDAFGGQLAHKKRSVTALQGTNSTAVFNEIELCEIIAPQTDDKINLYLLYGKDYTIDANGTVHCAAPKTIGDLRKSGDDSIFKKMREDLTIVDIIGDPGNNKILLALKNKNTTIDSLNEDIQQLTMLEILGDDIKSNKILKCLENSTINSLNDDIKGLKIVSVFEDDIYFKNADCEFTDKNGNVLTDGTKAMKGEWNYLLHSPNDPSKTPESYTVEDMGALTSNMTENIKKASIYKLNEDFNLKIDSSASSFLNYALIPANLEKLVTEGKMTEARKNELSGKNTGDLTIKELFDYIPTMTPALPY